MAKKSKKSKKKVKEPRLPKPSRHYIEAKKALDKLRKSILERSY